MVQDRTEINKKLNIDAFFPPFFSALIPELGRPQYARECVESLHRHADMPVEIILHDDGSPEPHQRQLFDELRNKVSTIVFDTGHNTGLARAFNRCRAMASSKYLIGFNSDTYVTTSFLRRMRTALDLPYVGLVNVVKEIADGPGVFVTPDGTKIQLMRSMGNFHCAGIRTSVWDSVGGWDENVQTTSSDVGFIGSVFGSGLFSVFIEGTVVNEMWLRTPDGLVNDVALSNPNYVMASEFTRGDNNTPPLFGLDPAIHSYLCEVRREYIWHGVNDFIQQDQYFPFWYNSNFQNKFFTEMFLPNNRIDWEVAKEFGHDRWKDQIIHDFKLEG